MPAHTCAIMRVATAATALQCERGQLICHWPWKHKMSCSCLAAFGEHVDGAVDADASWTISVVLHTAPRTFVDLQVRGFAGHASQRALLVCTACVMSVCSPVDVQCTSAVTSWSCAVCALSEWSKDPMLLEDLAWMSAGLCSAPRVRGPRSKSMSCLCSSVWRLPERPCPNRFGLWAQRRAESRACKCIAVALCTTACSRWPTAQLGFAKEPALSDQAWMLAGAEASTRWASFVQPVCICCR